MGLFLADGAGERAELTINVRQFKNVEISDGEIANAKPCQGEEMQTATALGTGYGTRPLGELVRREG